MLKRSARVVSLVFVFLAFLLSSNHAGAGLGEGLEAFEQHNYERALAEWEPLAASGNSDAQFFIGLLYYKGLGVQQDHAEARGYFQSAYEDGNAEAAFMLGTMYHLGRGGPADSLTALKILTYASDSGMTAATFSIGMMYLVGDGVEKNRSEGRRLVLKAAGEGFSMAELTLGVAHLFGDYGFPQDEAVAKDWFCRAGEVGVQRYALSTGRTLVCD
ncbi:MAG: tetratricopeptide repeat protein [Rhodospirillales bacterium]